eukprot:symbB.v1.2.002864.t1/scaffold130.1/size334612/15
MQQAFFVASSNVDRAPWRLAAIRRGLCILGARHGAGTVTKVALEGLEIHRRLKRFYGKLRTVTSPINWQWPIYGLEGVERLQQITENFMQSCHGLQVHMLEFAFKSKEVQNALQSANEWSPPPPPAKSNQYKGAFQQLLGVQQLHLEASVQPLMTRHGDVECALFLELRQTFYETLKVSQDATLDDIKAAFKRQALLVHPDKGGSKEAFHLVYQAFQILADRKLRGKYDRKVSASKKENERPKGSQSPILPKRDPDRFLLNQIKRCLQYLSREDRYHVISSDFSQSQRLLFEKWMRLEASSNSTGMGKRKASKEATGHNREDYKHIDHQRRKPKLAIKNSSKGQGKVTIRGIFTGGKGNKTTYSAGLGCNGLMVKTKACDLPTALEFLVVLTTWKHKALQYTQPGPQFVDAEEMQKALNDSAKEHGTSVAAMGLRFHAELANEYWFGRARHAWSPVVHTVHDICHINNMFCKYRTGGCRGFLSTRGPVQLQKSWEEFQEQYADMWRKAGKSSTRRLTQLRRNYDAALPFRDQRLQSWELLHMRLADTSSTSPSARALQQLRHRWLPLLGHSLPESAWLHVLVWCGLEAFPGDFRGCAEPDEPMAAMQLRLPKGCVCSSLQRVARGSLLQQALTSHGTVRMLLAFEPTQASLPVSRGSSLALPCRAHLPVGLMQPLGKRCWYSAGSLS